jgi:hypothetical protein
MPGDELTRLAARVQAGAGPEREVEGGHRDLLKLGDTLIVWPAAGDTHCPALR